MSNTDLEEMFSEALLKEGAGKLQKIVSGKLDTIDKDLSDKIKVLEENIKQKIGKLESLVSNKPISVNFGTVEQPENEIVHSCFLKVLKIIQSTKRINKNIMLVGQAGSGKTTLCSQVARALNLQFYPMSVGLQTTKSDLIGYLNVHGDYITTPIRQAFENGGLLLLDEFDSTHSGVVTILNSMLANDYCSFPDKVVSKHKDFVCIVSCNTYGKGGSIDYIGRNRLDGATLDRFITLNVDYDEDMENKLVNNTIWTKTIRKIRDNINKHGLKVIVSPRASMHGADLLESGFSIEEVLDMVIYKGCNSDIKTKLIQDIDLGVFNKTSADGSFLTYPDSTKAIEIKLDLNSGAYSMTGIQSDTSILSGSDWKGAYNIYLSSRNSYVAGLQGKNLYLNVGSGSLSLKGNNYRDFVRELETYSDTIHLELQPIHFNMLLEDGSSMKNIYLGN